MEAFRSLAQAHTLCRKRDEMPTTELLTFKVINLGIEQVIDTLS